MAIKGVIKNSVTADISAEQFASLFESLYGKNGICNIYEKLNCVKIDNNTVRLSSGVYNLSGYMLMVEKGTYEDFVIDSGTAGLKRNDLLIAEFVRNGLGTGIDVLTFRIVKGASVVGAASDPVLTAQDISADGTTRQEALYRIMIDGTNITSIVKLSPEIEALNSIYPQSGTNSKGVYTKYVDGTMECYQTVGVTSSAGGDVDVSLEFPSVFYNEPLVVAQLKAINHEGWNGNLYQGVTLDNSVRLVCVGLTPNQTYAISYIAKGRWRP